MITPHVTLMANMDGLRHNLNASGEEITGNMQEMMDEIGVGGLEYHTNKVLETIAESKI